MAPTQAAFTVSGNWETQNRKSLGCYTLSGLREWQLVGDEALGCYLLKQLEEFKTAQIVRSRDPKILEECDIVLDVGGVYEAGRHTIAALQSVMHSS